MARTKLEEVTTNTNENDLVDAQDYVSIIEFSEDIADAEAPEPLPVGEYPGTILKAERKESQRGTTYAAVTFNVSPDDYPADYPIEEAPDGSQLIYRRVSLEDNKRARFMLRRFCETIGAPMPSRTLNLSEWIGLDAKLHIEHEVYEGMPRAQIARVSQA